VLCCVVLCVVLLLCCCVVLCCIVMNEIPFLTHTSTANTTITRSTNTTKPNRISFENEATDLLIKLDNKDSAQVCCMLFAFLTFHITFHLSPFISHLSHHTPHTTHHTPHTTHHHRKQVKSCVISSTKQITKISNFFWGIFFVLLLLITFALAR
jgi:hypothetical protein